MLKADFFYRAIPWTELILRDRRFTNDLNIRHSERLCVVLTYGLVGALMGAIWWVPLLAVAALIMVSLVVINAPLYRFFLKKRGFRFALQSIPWHWLYYLYSGLAFAIGLARHVFLGSSKPGPTKSVLVPESFDTLRKPGRR
jgi:hypothetical protein